VTLHRLLLPRPLAMRDLSFHSSSLSLPSGTAAYIAAVNVVGRPRLVRRPPAMIFDASTSSPDKSSMHSESTDPPSESDSERAFFPSFFVACDACFIYCADPNAREVVVSRPRVARVGVSARMFHSKWSPIIRSSAITRRTFFFARSSSLSLWLLLELSLARSSSLSLSLAKALPDIARRAPESAADARARGASAGHRECRATPMCGGTWGRYLQR